ncbi:MULTISPECIES: ROK family protein [unclassified Arthrobacter]|uniref:ROK family transcriptional regulator n=1 Tax=unclassified Arthrobacter TaxID=235627 RepID=UPI003399A0F4
MRDGKPRTRAELTAQTGLSRSTIGARIDTLSELGLVKPVSYASSTGGRPSSQIAFNAGAGIVAAADLGATHAAIAITDLAGNRIAETHTRLEIADRPDDVLTSLAENITALLKQIDRDSRELIAIGIGLPGPVEHGTGKPSKPPLMPGWDGFDVPEAMRKKFQVPVLVDNDVNIMALGERSAQWPDTDHMIFVKVATGIGAGIISSGQLQRGADGTAGDIGHIPISRGALVPCSCGNMGCLEALASGPAVAAGLRKNGADVRTVADVIALVRAGDLPAIQAVRQAGRDIGEVLNMCVSIINPSVITIGGSMAEAGEHLIAGIREAVYSRSTPIATHHLTIAQSRSGPQAGVIGASILAIEHALSAERLESLHSRRTA